MNVHIFVPCFVDQLYPQVAFNMVKVLEFILYWVIVLLPFTVAISNGLANTFLGFIVFAYFLKNIF